MINRVSLDDREMNAVYHGLMLMGAFLANEATFPVKPILPSPWAGKDMPSAAQCIDLAERLHTGVDA